MLTKLRALKALWNDTPHVIQAGVLIFIGSATGAVTHYFTDSDPCFNWTCLRHLAGSAVHGGVTAAVAFYLLPSNKAAILAEISKAAPQADATKP